MAGSSRESWPATWVSWSGPPLTGRARSPTVSWESSGAMARRSRRPVPSRSQPTGAGRPRATGACPRTCRRCSCSSRSPRPTPRPRPMVMGMNSRQPGTAGRDGPFRGFDRVGPGPRTLRAGRPGSPHHSSTTQTWSTVATIDTDAPVTPARRGRARATGKDGLRLVIVESPRKARMISGYLGDGYVVESSIGHIRDLPRNAADVPAKYKGESWARLGVDVDNGFEPLYVVSPDRKAQVTKLKELLKDATELYLATDEDREGEAIAWHLVETLKPRVPIKRMVFHEITPEAIRRAVDNPRDIDADLVDAQETRRILDRLYGYEVSPVLWKKVMPRLSAGRVQSVATRLVVDRERERMAFRSASYWDLDAILDAGTDAAPPTFPARLTQVGARRVAQGRDFDSRGQLIDRGAAGLLHLDQPQAEALAESLRRDSSRFDAIASKPYTRRPYAPFRKTTLQEDAGRKIGFTAQRTMSVAQDLYEAGFITYMRTDSVTLSDTAITAARNQVRQLFGPDYLPDKLRIYTSKVKNAQEAHEAIRPAGEVFQTPAQTRLTGDQFRLYELIWMRTIASQMKDAEGHTISVKIIARTALESVDGRRDEAARQDPGGILRQAQDAGCTFE